MPSYAHCLEHIFSVRWLDNWSLYCEGTDACAEDDRFSLIQDRWYYMLLRVGDDGTFYVGVWARDAAPTEYRYNVRIEPGEPGWGEWTQWGFRVSVYSGRVAIDRFQELRFPEGFEMPASPEGLGGS